MIRKGTYILILDMPDAQVEVGALGILDIKKGSYCYVGSAMNGLDQRIARHLSKNKKIHWHIDHLTTVCGNAEAYEASEGISECGLCEIVRKNGGSEVFPGFGCSDCGCPTHLFFLTEKAKEKLVSDPFFFPHNQYSAGC
jgi:Uri superfamily endonuclease